MKYLDYTLAQGRLANQFYFALQAYISSKNEPTQYITDLEFLERNKLLPKLAVFGLERFVKTDYEFSPNDHIERNISSPNEWWKSWHQIFNVDFTLEQLKDFIGQTFLKTSLFNANSDDTIGLHIRFGDYCSSTISNCFDKERYLEKSIQELNARKVKCFSDDIEKSKELLNRFSDIEFEYSTNSTDIEDFIELSCLKKKILWNSTFSYWSAFIGNVIYPDSYSEICCPALFTSVEPIYDHCNPLWNNIKA